MKVSVTVEQKIVNGVARKKLYTITISEPRITIFGERLIACIHEITAPEAQELAEKLQAEVSKALEI